MSRTGELMHLTQALLPGGLPALHHRLQSEKGDFLKAITEAPSAPDSSGAEEGAESMAGAMPELFPAASGLMQNIPAQGRNALAEAASRAAGKILARGENADLTPVEADSFEAIVRVTGRPALFIQDGKFFPPPAGWQQLEGQRATIENTFRSVGRIEVDGHPTLPWVGTGWLAGPQVIITNRHVAKEFCRPVSAAAWEIEPTMKVRIDFHEELGSETAEEFRITNVIGIHERLDFALLRIEATATDGVTPAPAPLALMRHGPAENVQARDVYVVGYPAWDGRRNDPDVMMRIFGGVFNVKRLLPGQLIALDTTQPVLTHDCSTLGGNSGSVVIDLETHQVVGLHYSGFYGEYNQSIPLWTLQEDILIRESGLNFL